ncbi:4Fe-4S binding protein [Desulfohalobiaceae bacterium Ax17]|jgi:MinD superfamily P-loop ATPase|uniref:ATP-binding protein n=1 Tax=Desulfovulcanus ferrireducens TaxID=2831190 RepID=UPI00207BC923|nr:4Fe-4S binding protein [Desulfovulcanus ferrireducens]MBT8762380.1 4Fe-4S binding protein [Desulfovulcanus ferrireducens]
MKEIVVISGKGGTGKTSIVSSLAALGPKKVLADCDVDAADLHLVLHPQIKEKHDFISGEKATIDPELCIECGECREKCRFGAISDNFKVLPEHCEGCGVCAYVCPADAVKMSPSHCGYLYVSDTRFGPMVHASLGIGEENSGKLVTTVRKKAAELAREYGYELVLVDGSPGIGCPVIASLTNADLAVIVVEPTISAEHDMRRVHELTQHFNIQCLVILNKADINVSISERIKDYCHKAEIPVLGTLPYDIKFTRAQIEGKSVVEFDPHGLGKEIEKIWQKMMSF